MIYILETSYLTNDNLLDREYPESERRTELAIAIDDFACPANANETRDCTSNSIHNCFHPEDIFIECGEVFPLLFRAQRTYQIEVW